jgi:hypothetical protein
MVATEAVAGDGPEAEVGAHLSHEDQQEMVPSPPDDLLQAQRRSRA